MRYELKRNTNGMITQCDTNADGGNIYAQREEINKQALANLERPTPGKLGGLSNLQIFNFQISDIETGDGSVIRKEYNTTSTFPANATQTVMFGVEGSNNKAMYYNVVDVKASVYNSNPTDIKIRVQEDSYIEFYILQNNETSTSSLGTKIPQPAPLSGNGGGAVTFETSGNEFGAQAIPVSFTDDSVIIPSNSKGIRCSGLALKTIFINFVEAEIRQSIEVRVTVFVDTTSVSQTY